MLSIRPFYKPGAPCPTRTLSCEDEPLCAVQLRDRRCDTPTDRWWVFQADLERRLYGNEWSTGALYRLLHRANVQSEVLTLRACDVKEGLVTRGEFAHLKRLMCELGTRVRNVTLVPLEAAGVAVRAYGPSLQSVALLTALGASCPWPAKEEEEPPPLPAPSAMAVEPTEAEEEKSTSLASELLEDEADREESHAESYALATVSDELRADFVAYEQHRTTPINRRREGSACLELTVANDRANALRFLGWLEATEGIEPSLGAVFGTPWLGAWVEAYLSFLTERGLKQSTLASYTSGLLNLANYVHEVGLATPEAAHAPAEVLRLRHQLEKGAREERLYAPPDPHLITWDEAQRGRLRAIEAWRASDAELEPPTVKAEAMLLRDMLILLFHTAQPPDRVGVIRKLRLGYSLHRSGSHYELDLTLPNSHKTAKFYGATRTTISSLIGPWLTRYIALRPLTNGDYLFHPLTDPSRAVSPAQWCALVKACFQRHTGVPVSPKQMRAAFVTFLKGQTDAPGVLQAAATAMRHSTSMQGSDRYDVARNDRLVAAAVELCEQYATDFAPLTSETLAVPSSQTVPMSTIEEARGEMSEEQCAALVTTIQTLEGDQIAKVAELVSPNRRREPDLELDVRALDNAALWKLNDLLETFKASTADSNKRAREEEEEEEAAETADESKDDSLVDHIAERLIANAKERASRAPTPIATNPIADGFVPIKPIEMVEPPASEA